MNTEKQLFLDDLFGKTLKELKIHPYVLQKNYRKYSNDNRLKVYQTLKKVFLTLDPTNLFEYLIIDKNCIPCTYKTCAEHTATYVFKFHNMYTICSTCYAKRQTIFCSATCLIEDTYYYLRRDTELFGMEFRLWLKNKSDPYIFTFWVLRHYLPKDIVNLILPVEFK
jgi:hypothetical protein